MPTDEQCEQQCKGECFMDCDEMQGLPATGKADRQVDELHKKIDDLLSLLDGAVEIVELYKPATPAQDVWRRRWLKEAKQHGIQGEPK